MTEGKTKRRTLSRWLAAIHNTWLKRVVFVAFLVVFGVHIVAMSLGIREWWMGAGAISTAIVAEGVVLTLGFRRLMRGE